MVSIPRYFAGIDFGTSGCRIIVIDQSQTIVAQHRVALPPAEIWREHQAQDPEIWWRALESLFAHLRATFDISGITSLSIDGTSGTVLLTDDAGKPILPALMYHDQAIAYAERISKFAPTTSGARGATSGLAKILFLLAQPEAEFARLFFSQADWLSFRLTEKIKQTDENNALKSGYDPIKREWPSWLAELEPRLTNMLPQCFSPGTEYGKISSSIARKLGLNDDVKIIAGTTDSNAAVIATGISEIGDAVTSLGSTLVVKLISNKPVFAPEYGVYSHRLGERWLVGGASNTGGATLLKFFTIEEMNQLIPLLEPNRPTGFDYYPLPRTGERFPINDPHLEPRIEPMPPQRHVFFQALLEGIAKIERDAYRKLEQLGAIYPQRVLTCGGGARNHAWQQIRARLLGVPVLQADQDEAAYGSTMLAFRGYHRTLG